MPCGSCLEEQQSAIVSSTPTARDSSSEECRMGQLMMPQSGMTCRHSLGKNSRGWLMASSGEFLASLIPLPVSNLEKTTPVIFGLQCGEELASYDRDFYYWKMSQGCSPQRKGNGRKSKPKTGGLSGTTAPPEPEESDEYLVSWPSWGTTRNGRLYLLRKPAPPTCGRESGSWPTPSAQMPGAGVTNSKVQNLLRGSRHSFYLTQAVAAEEMKPGVITGKKFPTTYSPSTVSASSPSPLTWKREGETPIRSENTWFSSRKCS